MLKPTDCDDLLRLTNRQETAIELLLAGKSDSQVAKEIGIHRTTISRWRSFHLGFKAELARRRAERFSFAADRLQALVPKALDVFENALDGEKKLPVAIAILRMAGLDEADLPPIENDTAEEMLTELVRERLAKKEGERIEGLGHTERLIENLNPPPRNLAEEVRLALQEVKAELREKLSETQSSVSTD